MSKYGVFPSPDFPVFRLNTGKCRPEKTLYLGTFHAFYILYKMKQCFPKPDQCSSGNVKVECYVSNYATKTN